MKTLSTTFFLLLFTLGAVRTQAQTADEIVNKYITAIGGKDAIAGVKTIYAENNVSVMGNDAPSTTTIVDGKGYKNTVDFNGQQIVQVVTPTGGWAINPMTGAATATPMPEEQFKSSRYQLDIGGPLVDYKTKGSTVELLGKDTAFGGSYKLKLTTKDKVVMNFYVDANTSLVDRLSTQVTGVDGDITMNLSNYKKVDGGFLMPYSEEIILPQITLAITIKSIVVNKTIDPAIFDMPK